MRITDLKSAIIGNNICLRVKTDKGIDGYSQVEENRTSSTSTCPTSAT